MAIKIKRQQASDITTAIKPDLHPVLNRIYHNRGITSASELELSLEHLLNYESLTGIERAAELLEQAIAQDKSILIIGDFDADGATSTALAMRALNDFWCRRVDRLLRQSPRNTRT